MQRHTSASGRNCDSGYEKRGTLKSIQNVLTQSKRFKGQITTADLHLTPDAPFLYVCNRDTSKRGAATGKDSLVGFRVDPQTEHLKLIGHYTCERIPGSFTIDNPGRFLYVAGQGDARLGAYRIEKSGALDKIKQYEVDKAPIWIETLSILE